MDEKQERRLRRTMIRLWLRGASDRQIQEQVPRSLGWIHKWQRRFIQAGWGGLKSQSRERHHPSGYAAPVRRIVLRVRKQLAKRKVGRVVGARAIQRVIREARLLPRKQRPSRATIKRILREARLTSRRRTRAVYRPHPTPNDDYIIQAMDWTLRSLEGGAKVYAFHSLDLAIHDLYQTISDNKRGETAEAHALKTWSALGLPHALLIDNDAAWRGSLKTARYFSHFMHLALWLGIELIFIPLAEAEFNGAVERVNGLWSQQFWNLRHFGSRAHVRRCSPEFVTWYRTDYEPPRLGERTPAEARRQVVRCRLTAAQSRAIPARLPLTAGRIHFIRLVDPHGDIQLLHESWHVDRRLAGHYVWATITLQEQRLRIYHRRSAHDAVRLRKTYGYTLPEPVVALQTQFKRFERRRNLFTMW
jgi:transposase